MPAVISPETQTKISELQVVVLAGGKGTRLKTITGDCLPKSLVPVGGKPIIDHLLDSLEGIGFHHFIFLTGFLSDQIEQHLSNREKNAPSSSIRYLYSAEKKPLGTGGAIQQAIEQGSIDDEFFLVTSDAFFPWQSIIELVNHHLQNSPSDVTWAITSTWLEAASQHITHQHVGPKLVHIDKFQPWPKLSLKNDELIISNDSGHGIISKNAFTKAWELNQRFHSRFLDSFPESVCWYKDLLPLLAELQKRSLIRNRPQPSINCYDEKQPYLDIGTVEGYQYATTIINQRSTNVFSRS